MGASGWFGRTALSLIPKDAVSLAIGGRSNAFPRWSTSAIEAFQPTHVLGCAFLTKEKLKSMEARDYWEVNEMLIDRFRFAASQPSCIAALAISSGSVISDPEHPYSRLKALEEQACADLVTSRRGAVVLRAFSVSGPFVQRVHDYAFSDLLAQALGDNRTVVVRAPSEVWRRYVDVGEALRVSLASIEPGRYHMIETGGPLIELRELAQLIARELGGKVEWQPPAGKAPQIYASNNASWQSACAATGIQPSGIRQQIKLTLTGCPLASALVSRPTLN